MILKLTKSVSRHCAQLEELFRNEDGELRKRTICTLGRLETGGDVGKLIAALQRARLGGARRQQSPGCPALPGQPWYRRCLGVVAAVAQGRLR